MQMRFIVRQLAHIAVLSYPATLFSGPACGLSILNALLEIIKAIKILLTLLTFWKDYLALEKMRFEERLNIQMDIDEDDEIVSDEDLCSMVLPSVVQPVNSPLKQQTGHKSRQQQIAKETRQDDDVNTYQEANTQRKKYQDKVAAINHLK